MFSAGDARRKTSDDQSGRLAQDREQCKREKGFEKTLEDTFPASDPPSSIPDPCLEDADEEAA
jgi:hypothetical protein